MYEENRIGKIIGGLYLEGFVIKVEDDFVVESIRIGIIFVSEIEKRKYYCMFIDMVIEGMNK